MSNNEITQIAADRLRPHPDNPRRDVGDVTELADSIRAKGIMQNLTVVPDDPADPDTTYTVIIGHRRLAAARQAGSRRRNRKRRTKIAKMRKSG